MTHFPCILRHIKAVVFPALVLACSGVAISMSAPQARADFIPGSIPTLFNTGVDNNGVVLPDGAGDPHYALTQTLIGNGVGAPNNGPGFVVNSNVPPVTGPWFPDTSTSKWIGPNANQAAGAFPSSPTSANLNQVPYVYVAHFDLTGFNSATQTASVSGMWASDNTATMKLNGVQVATINAEPTFQVLHSFSFNSLTNTFIAGQNTLEFDVINLYPPPPFDPVVNNPTGLRVEIAGVVTTNVVPEPGTLTLAGLGVVGLAGFGWRHRRRSSCT